MMPRRALLLCASAALLMLGAKTAGAATSTGTFQVTITLQAACQIVTMTNLSFGTAGVLNANVDATNTITVQCSNTTPYTIALNVGTGTGATCAARLMTAAGATVTYSIYTTAARNTVWCDGTGSSATQAGTGTGAAQSYTGFGRVPSQNTPAPGTYTDTITATVTF